MGFTLSWRWTDTILWKELSRIHGEHHDMLLTCWRKWSSMNLPAKCQNKIFGMTSNLTWLQAVVRNYEFSTSMAGIRLGAEHQKCWGLSQFSRKYLHALLWSTFQELWLLEVGRAVKILFWTELSILRIFELLTPIWVPSQETFNTNIIANCLRFLMATHMH
jgi:hypothetical protein